MTQEDKELLLKDLSVRLPYGVKCCVKNNHKVCGILNGIVGENIHLYSSGCSTYNISVIKPYLRPMSSMTEKEEIEYDTIFAKPWYNSFYIDNLLNGFDWLDRHHFDYRGLIEKELALEAPEGMYN